MPRFGEPFSVPDPDAEAWTAMVSENGRLQAKNDPLSGKVGPSVPAGGSPTRQVNASIDPGRTGVFVRGPDGKLHPIAGWNTTGPFDAGAWAHNIDWTGVLRDLATIASSSIGGAGLPGLLTGRGVAGVVGGGLTAADKLTLGAGAAAAAGKSLDAVAPKKAPPHQ